VSHFPSIYYRYSAREPLEISDTGFYVSISHLTNTVKPLTPATENQPWALSFHHLLPDSTTRFLPADALLTSQGLSDAARNTCSKQDGIS